MQGSKFSIENKDVFYSTALHLTVLDFCHLSKTSKKLNELVETIWENNIYDTFDRRLYLSKLYMHFSYSQEEIKERLLKLFNPLFEHVETSYIEKTFPHVLQTLIEAKAKFFKLAELHELLKMEICPLSRSIRKKAELINFHIASQLQKLEKEVPLEQTYGIPLEDLPHISKIMNSLVESENDECLEDPLYLSKIYSNLTFNKKELTKVNQFLKIQTFNALNSVKIEDLEENERKKILNKIKHDSKVLTSNICQINIETSAKIYTAAELRELIKRYSTPNGRLLVEKINKFFLFLTEEVNKSPLIIQGLASNPKSPSP